MTYKGSDNYKRKHSRFLHHRSGVRKYWKKLSNKRIRRMKDDGEKFWFSYKLIYTEYLIIIQW